MKIKLIYVVKMYIALFGYRLPDKRKVKTARTVTGCMIIFFNTGKEDAQSGKNEVLSLYGEYGNMFPDYPEVSRKIWELCRKSYMEGQEVRP